MCCIKTREETKIEKQATEDQQEVYLQVNQCSKRMENEDIKAANLE
jgi:hypothetical protein